jgi:Cell wall-active antibiotics response 4TMS YvqF/Domain of unknown function (DUF1707)
MKPMDSGAYQQMPEPGRAKASGPTVDLQPRRDEALAYLRRHIHDGDLTLEEYGVRVERVLVGATAQEILSAVDGLPALSDPVMMPLPAGAPQPSAQAHWQGADRPTGVKVDQSRDAARSRNMFSIFGEAKLRGKWRAGRSVSVLALFGGATIDLRDATLTADELVITGLVMFGSLQIIVPPGSDVEVEGLVLFGSRSHDADDDEPLPGMPVIRIATTVAFGDISVKVRSSTDGKRRNRKRG